MKTLLIETKDAVHAIEIKYEGVLTLGLLLSRIAEQYGAKAEKTGAWPALCANIGVRVTMDGKSFGTCLIDTTGGLRHAPEKAMLRMDVPVSCIGYMPHKVKEASITDWHREDPQDICYVGIQADLEAGTAEETDDGGGRHTAYEYAGYVYRKDTESYEQLTHRDVPPGICLSRLHESIKNLVSGDKEGIYDQTRTALKRRAVTTAFGPWETVYETDMDLEQFAGENRENMDAFCDAVIDKLGGPEAIRPYIPYTDKQLDRYREEEEDGSGGAGLALWNTAVLFYVNPADEKTMNTGLTGLLAKHGVSATDKTELVNIAKRAAKRIAEKRRENP